MVADMNRTLEPAALRFGVDTFGDLQEGDFALTLRRLVDQARLADEVGLHAINLGEHHRDDYAVSAPDTVLAYIAGVTENLHLGTAVIVLSSDDPVRVYERISTLHALSGGRAELTVGRGSFTESFPLFGYELSHYEGLFEEKLAMLVRLWRERPASWDGELAQSLHEQEVFPPLDAAGSVPPLAVAVGGSPQSVVRAACHDLDLRVAVIGGAPERFAGFTDLYRRAQEEFGHAAGRSIGFHSPGLIADTDEEAAEAFYEQYAANSNRVGAERGWPRMTRARFADEVAHGALFVGSPETVARKAARAMLALGADTFDLKLGLGAQEAQLRSIELLGTRVAPLVREMVADGAAS